MAGETKGDQPTPDYNAERRKRGLVPGTYWFSKKDREAIARLKESGLAAHDVDVIRTCLRTMDALYGYMDRGDAKNFRSAIRKLMQSQGDGVEHAGDGESEHGAGEPGGG